VIIYRLYKYIYLTAYTIRAGKYICFKVQYVCVAYRSRRLPLKTDGATFYQSHPVQRGESLHDVNSQTNTVP
jgi:hypothetical protein